MRTSHLIMLGLLCVCGCTAAQTGKQAETDSAPDTSAHTDSKTDSDTDTGLQDTDIAESACTPGDIKPLSTVSCATTAPCMWTSSSLGSRFGASIDGAHDLNGDGIPDIVVSAPLDDMQQNGTNRIDTGSVRVFSGADIERTNDAAVFFQGTETGEYFGGTVRTIDDTNGDARSDLLIGARRASGILKNAGRVSLYFGHSQLEKMPQDPVHIVGTTEYSEFGSRLSSAGDVNGDGLMDFVITDELKSSKTDQNRYYRGTVRLFYGRDVWEPVLTSVDADQSFIGNSDTGGTGLGLAPGGDFDGDGHIDIAIGSPYQGSGRAGIVHAIRGAITAEESTTFIDEAADRTFEGTTASSACGWTLAVGDWNQDERADLAIGCPLGDKAGINAGEVLIYYGRDDFFSDPSTPDSVLTGSFDRFEFGTSLQPLSDVNGDGIQDLAIGSLKTYRGFAAQSGKVHVFYGSKESWAETRTAATSEIGIHGDGTKHYLGATLSGSDMNQDGLTDLMFSTASGETLYLFFSTLD